MQLTAMTPHMSTVLSWAVLVASLPNCAATAPRFIFTVIVDDLGWGDVGFHQTSHNNETKTPNIDELAGAGVILERQYVSSECTPSRSSFFSGRFPVHVQQTLDNPEMPNAGIPRNMTVIGSKMKQGGFATHVVGKWDIGMATPTHTPEGRGFDSSLIYFEHKNDYWTQAAMQTQCTDYGHIWDLWDTGAPAYGKNGTDYEEFMFHDRVYSIIDAHNFEEQPLFLVYTPHIVHCPLQVPEVWLDKFGWITDDESLCSAQTPYIFPGSTNSSFRCRSQYEAMVALLDDVLGNLTGLIKQKGLWNETLMVVSTDNGGPLILQESGASNAPLRGGKYSDWEGGIRGTAFVSGGYLPSAVRGTSQSGTVHLTDWYSTYCAFAGVDPEDPVAKVAGLPPIDSVNVWPLISGANSTSPRTEIPVSLQTLLQGDLKLIVGEMSFAGWQGAHYPNASSAQQPVDYTLQCGNGCLFNVSADPTEHVDLASQMPQTVTQMLDRLTQLKKSYFSNNDTGVDISSCSSNMSMPCACYVALHQNNGFLGPFQV